MFLYQIKLENISSDYQSPEEGDKHPHTPDHRCSRTLALHRSTSGETRCDKGNMSSFKAALLRNIETVSFILKESHLLC